MGKDALGDRMKGHYENRTRYHLPRRTYTVIRIDGKAFHTYCRGLKKPFDLDFIDDMDRTAIYLCKNIQGAKCAFVQSDEISIILTDFDNNKTDAWFDGNIQKIVSVSSSMATGKFNQLRMTRLFSQVAREVSFPCMPLEDFEKIKIAEFDARVFTIPQKEEVYNHLIFRQQDTVRNSISSVAQSLYSHKELDGKNQNEMQEMCFQKGVNWNDFGPKLKRGRLIIRKEVQMETPFVSNDKCQSSYSRNVWMSVAAPTFTADKTLLEEIFNK